MTIGKSRPWPSASVCSRSDTIADPAGAAAPLGYPLAVMRKRFRILQHFTAGLLALMLAFAPAAPAQANILNCIEAVAPIDDAAKAAALAAKLSACTTQAAGGDAVMAMTIATMAALAVSGVIPADTQGCQNVADGVIGQVLALALIQSGLAAQLGGVIEDALIQLASGDGAIKLSDIPALQFLFQYVNCGCTVVGTPAELQEITDNYLAKVQGCADFLGDAAQAIVDWVEDAATAIVCFFSDCADESAGPPNNFCLPGQWCAFGEQCGGYQHNFICLDCIGVPHGVGISEGKCGCEPPYAPTYFGPKLVGCDLCPDGLHAKNQHCVPCASNERYSSSEHTCKSCLLGEKASLDHTSCIPACNSGEILESSGCKKCDENTQAVYVGIVGGMGSCQKCLPGSSAPAGSTQCYADCGTNAYRDPDNPMNCLFCGFGQHYEPFGQRCECAEGQITDGLTCACPTGDAQFTGDGIICCPKGGHFDQKTAACVCPEGAAPDPTGTKCVCPPGMKCGPPAQGGLTKKKAPSKDCSALGAAFINNPKNATQCIRCSGGRVANAARTACVAKPGLLQRSAPPTTGEKKSKPALQCPPNRIPNAKGTACILQLDQPDFGTPGSLPSGGGRGVPGGVPGVGGPPTRR